MTTYRVGLAVRDDGADGWVFDLPGCRAAGATVDEVMGLLPAVIGDHLVWLARHDALPAGGFDFDIKVVEELHSDAEFAFEADKEPVAEDDIEAAVRLMGFARDDLVDLFQPLPDVVLDWRVPATAVKIDDRYPDVRSMRDMVNHVGAAMSFHIRGVGDVAARVASPEGPPTLDTAFATAVARLCATNQEERSGKVYTLAGGRVESDWTLRKSFRRLLNHQRFHTREIMQRLAWLTLGVPEFLPKTRE